MNSLVFGPESQSDISNSWLKTDEGRAAVDHLTSIIDFNKAALNILVIQSDTAPVRMRATWPWAPSEGLVLPFHAVAMTSSALPGEPANSCRCHGVLVSQPILVVATVFWCLVVTALVFFLQLRYNLSVCDYNRSSKCGQF